MAEVAVEKMVLLGLHVWHSRVPRTPNVPKPLVELMVQQTLVKLHLLADAWLEGSSILESFGQGRVGL